MIPEKNVPYLQAEVDNDVQEAYGKVLWDYTKRNVTMALKLATGVVPNEKVARMAYERLIENGRVNNLWWLNEFEVPPIDLRTLSRETVQKGYDRIFERNLYDAKQLLQLTGIAPNEESVQREYGKCFEIGDIYKAKYLNEFTGIRPDVGGDFMRMTYERYLAFGMFQAGRMLRDFTGVKPELSEETVQKNYGRYIEASLIETANELVSFSGIKPKVSKSAVIKGYETCFEGCRLHSIKLLEKITGVRPKPSKKAVQEGYEHCARTYDYCGAEELMELTGIAPSKKFLRQHPEFADVLSKRRGRK